MTIRVRIGVAVDGSGKYAAVGWSKITDEEIYMAGDGLDADARYFWLEADLPGPEIETRTAQEVIQAPDPSQC